MSIPLSFANFQAASSAKILERGYHFCKKLEKQHKQEHLVTGSVKGESLNRLGENKNGVDYMISTFDSRQKSGSEYQLSSTTTSGLKGLPLYNTAAIEDVRTTLFIDGTFAQELRTLSVPFTAGSSNSA